MSSNPYQSPSQPSSPHVPVAGVLSGNREDLRSVAKYQKRVLICVLINVAMVIFLTLAPTGAHGLFGLTFLITGLVGGVYVFLLSTKIYSTGVGILLGILALIPCFGFAVLVVVSGKATRILKQNGIWVGLLGANLSKI